MANQSCPSTEVLAAPSTNSEQTQRKDLIRSVQEFETAEKYSSRRNIVTGTCTVCLRRIVNAQLQLWLYKLFSFHDYVTIKP